jgi:peptide/nickel transport system substrate-binding protein
VKKVCVWFFLLIITLSLLLPACASQSSPTSSAAPKTSQAATTPQAAKTAATSAPQSGGVLRIIRVDGPTQIGAQTDEQNVNQNYGLPVFDPLAWFDEVGQPVLGPGRLATAVDVAPDGKSITLTIRKGVKFHDGTDFNAEAVKYNYTNLRTASRSFLKNVTSIDVVNDYTLRFNLSAFDISLVENIPMGSGYIASPTAIQKKVAVDDLIQHCVGTGPFKIVSWQRNIGAKYEKFSGYWDQGKPYLDGMEIKGIADPTVALLAFQSGEGDVLVEPSPADAVKLKEKGFRIVSEMGLGPALIPDGANADSPFANKLVRQALDYAIDRETLAKGIGYGFYEAAYQPCYAKLGYNPDITGRKYDPAKAKQLLTDAGYPKGFKTTLYFTAVKGIGSTMTNDEIAAIQNYLREVGIDAQIETIDTARSTSLNQNGWHGIIVGDALAGPAVMGVTQRRLDIAANVNKSIYRPAGFQEIFDAARVEPNLEKRQASVKKMTRVMYDEAMLTPLWKKVGITALKPTVKDSKIGETGYGYLWYTGGTWISK